MLLDAVATYPDWCRVIDGKVPYYVLKYGQSIAPLQGRLALRTDEKVALTGSNPE